MMTSCWQSFSFPFLQNWNNHFKLIHSDCEWSFRPPHWIINHHKYLIFILFVWKTPTLICEVILRAGLQSKLRLVTQDSPPALIGWACCQSSVSDHASKLLQADSSMNEFKPLLIFLCNALVWPAEGDIYHQLFQHEGSIPQVTTPVCVSEEHLMFYSCLKTFMLTASVVSETLCSVPVMWLILHWPAEDFTAEFTDLYKKFEYHEKVHLFP